MGQIHTHNTPGNVTYNGTIAGILHRWANKPELARLGNKAPSLEPTPRRKGKGRK